MTLRTGIVLDLRNGAGQDCPPCPSLADDHLIFHYQLAGSIAIKVDGTAVALVEPGMMVRLRSTHGNSILDPAQSASTARSVTLLCDSDVAKRLFLDVPNAAGSAMGLIENGVFNSSIETHPIRPAMQILIEDMLAPPAFGSDLHHLLIEARALELLFDTVRFLVERHVVRVSTRKSHRAKVRELCAFLEEHCSESHPLPELSARFSLCETVMLEKFKKYTGTTISDYRQGFRLERARRELEQSDALIGEVAVRAGYGHSSNFSTAFLRRFGISPREARLHAKRSSAADKEPHAPGDDS